MYNDNLYILQNYSLFVLQCNKFIKIIQNGAFVTGFYMDYKDFMHLEGHFSQKKN